MDAILTRLLPSAATRYGATMGRRTFGPTQGPVAGPFYLRKLRLSQGYDEGGAYWGDRPAGLSLYGYMTHDGNTSGFFDATDRKDALERLRLRFPPARLAR